MFVFIKMLINKYRSVYVTIAYKLSVHVTIAFKLFAFSVTFLEYGLWIIVT